MVADAPASVATENIIIRSAISTKGSTSVEQVTLLNSHQRLALLNNGLRLSLSLSRAGVVGVPDPALSAPPTDLVADGHLACVGVTELVAVNVADGTESRALVEEVALLDLDGRFRLALGGAGVHSVADPAVVAELVADRHSARVGIAKAVVVSSTVATEDTALVELVAFVQQGVGTGKGKADKAGDREESELHIDELKLRG
jgi:hypothetical protein